MTRELRSQQAQQNEIHEDDNNNPNMKKKLLKRDPIVNVDLPKIKVADLTFCRDNGPIIRLLEERGDHINDQEFDKMHKIERDINDMIKTNYD